jgi:hypothetical protein
MIIPFERHAVIVSATVSVTATAIDSVSDALCVHVVFASSGDGPASQQRYPDSGVPLRKHIWVFLVCLGYDYTRRETSGYCYCYCAATATVMILQLMHCGCVWLRSGGDCPASQ